jgi:pimeloyl-ACP methyl ester carboxylesterase
MGSSPDAGRARPPLAWCVTLLEGFMTTNTTSAQRPSATARQAHDRLISGLPVTSRRLHLSGVNTFILEGGEGPPMILLHGPGAYAASWLRVIPALVRSNRVIVPDLPGHGMSEVTQGNLDPDHVVAWLDELIDRTCSAPPVVIGNNLGGAIALRHAIDRPGRMRRLFAVDSFGLAPFEPLPEFGAALHAFMADPTATSHTALWHQCAYDFVRLQERLGDAWQPFETYNLDRSKAPDVMAAVQTLMETMSGPIAPSDLMGIETPVTLVWGRHDRAIPLTIAETASARYGWPLVVIEDCADSPPIEQPEALVRVLT